MASKDTYRVTKNEDTYTLTSHGRSQSFKSGVEFEDSSTGSKAKCLYVVDGDTITSTQKFAEGRSITLKSVFNGDKLVLSSTSTNWNGTAYSYYSA